ncbi:MAG: hypothetical protein IJ146_03510 [Kiritimatiellae bacterium]|nr:hypothetical protein [Kiritimatiellia bacterium]
MKHRATGRSRGRPTSVPFSLGDQIYDILKSRMDPVTHLVYPQWQRLARELHVSRSTISRVMPGLKSAGFIESVIVPMSKDGKIKRIVYRILR